MIDKNKINQSCKFISDKGGKHLDVIIVLGTGLNKVADIFKSKIKIPYSNIPNFKFSTAPSHKGNLLIGNFSNLNVAVMQGRLHLYEGYTAQDVVYPLYVLNQLGAQNLVITNAAGSLNKKLQTGNIALIKDHINLTGKNPLVGKNNSEFGTRFPSMNNAYDRELIEDAQKVSLKHKLAIETAIYAGLLGPNLETKAECNMLRKMGADLVGMSTVLEVIAANYLGMKVLGISAITNMSNLFHAQSHKQADIEKAALKAENKLVTLLKNLLPKL